VDRDLPVKEILSVDAGRKLPRFGGKRLRLLIQPAARGRYDYFEQITSWEQTQGVIKKLSTIDRR